MKHFISISFLFLFCLVFHSCSLTKEPEYIGVERFSVENFNTKEVVLKGELKFYNPNAVGAKVESDNLTIWYKGKKIANVDALPFQAQSKETFLVPLLVKVPAAQFLKENSIDILKGFFGAKTDKEKTFDLTIKGDLTFKIAGVKFKKELNEVEKITL